MKESTVRKWARKNRLSVDINSVKLDPIVINSGGGYVGDFIAYMKVAKNRVQVSDFLRLTTVHSRPFKKVYRGGRRVQRLKALSIYRGGK